MDTEDTAAGEPGRGQRLKTATFAGGCFWCTEADYEKLPGVISAISGYTGGRTENPTYEEVSAGATGHVEAVRVTYDPERISYEELLEHFWKTIDPTDARGQFVDRGPQYRTAIFYHDEEQRQAAERSKAALERSGRFGGKVATEIRPLGKFYPAEDYHQDYFKKQPDRYFLYRSGSGRDQFREKTWGAEGAAAGSESGADRPEAATADPGSRQDRERPAGRTYRKPEDETLHKRLTPLQYAVTQRHGTERPFDNVYWNEKRAGIYVDVVSGEPLFSSRDKFDSGTGWPSFTRPLEPGNVVALADRSHGMERTEVRSRGADSHLGHLFADGPPPAGVRYCMNSAALRFIPKEDLAKEGYGDYMRLFEDDRAE